MKNHPKNLPGRKGPFIRPGPLRVLCASVVKTDSTARFARDTEERRCGVGPDAGMRISGLILNNRPGRKDLSFVPNLSVPSAPLCENFSHRPLRSRHRGTEVWRGTGCWYAYFRAHSKQSSRKKTPLIRSEPLRALCVSVVKTDSTARFARDTEGRRCVVGRKVV